MLKPVAVAAVLLALAAAQAVAQDQPLPDKPQPRATPKPKKERILWVVPAFDVRQYHDPYTPLTPREKFNLFTDTTFDRITFISAAFDAGINQATNTPEGYGQGMEGYAKRYGAAVADAATSNLLGRFVFPVAFRQDPRYFRLQQASGKRRLGYAVSRVFIARGDNGRDQVNASQLLGAFSSAAITNVWLPPRDRDVETTLIRGASRLGVSMGFNVLKEFWPEIGPRLRLGK